MSTTIAKVLRIGYIPNDKVHTVAYRDDCLRFIGGSDHRRIGETTSLAEGRFKWGFSTVDPKFAMKVVADQIAVDAARCKINPADIWVSFATVEATEGLFWPPGGDTQRKHRVSDLEIVSVLEM